MVDVHNPTVFPTTNRQIELRSVEKIASQSTKETFQSILTIPPDGLPPTMTPALSAGQFHPTGRGVLASLLENPQPGS